MDAEREATTQKPGAAELLRAALEKIVFFEWRLSELSAELSAAQARCAAEEQARAEAENEAHAAAQRAKAARLQSAAIEADRARLAVLLANPAHGRPAPDLTALDAERQRSAGLQDALDSARAELARSHAERERWLSEMLEQARAGDEAPAALAQFISELRGEIIALRDHQKRCEELLASAGIAPPAMRVSRPSQPPRREPEPVTEARRMWDEGRLSPVPAQTTHFALPPQPRLGAAAQALLDQSLRTLAGGDPRRREQAARHLAAAPSPVAAPALASALGAETEPKARAQLAKALVACGGEGAAQMVARLQDAAEHALVRLGALEALCTLPAHARAALESAAGDAVVAVRRRAAALATAQGMDDLISRFAADADGSVRAAVAAAQREAPAAVRDVAPAPIAPAPRPAPEPAVVAPAPRDPVRAALHRLVLGGGAS